MVCLRYWSNGAISTMSKSTWPLMHNNVTRSDLDVLIEYLRNDDPKLTHGPLVQKFEEEWSKWLGVKHSVMLNSGSSANDLTMMALRELKGPGEVIVPPLTWVSDISAVLRSGFTPIFVDIDPRSLAMDSEKILESITPRTRGVFLTHVLGFNGLTDALLEGLRRKNIPLVEDVCESHGTMHGKRKVGTFGWASNFSFYYAHHLTTIEGGMVSTNDSELFEVIRMMRSHGMVRESSSSELKQNYANNHPDLNSDFIFAYASHNMRPTELNGLLGLEQLPRLEENNVIRSRNLNLFLSLLDSRLFQTEFQVEGNSNYALTLVLRNPDMNLREKVESILKEAGIEFRRGLSGGGNQLRQPYLRSIPNIPAPETMPNTDHVHHYGWYIGNYPELSTERIISLGKILEKLSSNYGNISR